MSSKIQSRDPFLKSYNRNNKQDAPYILFYQARDYFNKSIGKFTDFKLAYNFPLEKSSINIML